MHLLASLSGLILLPVSFYSDSDADKKWTAIGREEIAAGNLLTRHIGPEY